MSRQYGVGEVARRAHVTVRTLHHYDEIGLLHPTDRGSNGYRRYTDDDLRRLHRILLYRELGFPLDAIGPLLDDPAFDHRSALRAQRAELDGKVRRLRAVIRAVDATLASMERGETMSTDELFDGFEDFDPSEYEDEVKERWGDTDAYRESMRRTRKYSKDDWNRIRAEGDEIIAAMVRLQAGGGEPEATAAMDLAERHRRHIDRWFYPCAPRMHAGLADMYEADPRFGEYFESRGEGLTAFAAAAIRANAERQASTG